MKKNRASLVLAEQLVMLLVFALCACVCLTAFLRADQTSRETRLRDEAAILAQNGVETVKACGGDLEQAGQLLGGQCRDGQLLLEQGALTLTASHVEQTVPGLGVARVRVIQTESGRELYTLEAAWQEVIP